MLWGLYRIKLGGMTKIYLVLALFLLLGKGLLFAQDRATEEALERACTCFGNQNFGTISMLQADAVADSCLQYALYTNLTGVLEEQKASLKNSESMLRVAQLFSSYLSENCVGFRAYSDKIAQQKVEIIKQKNSSTVGLLYALECEGKFPVFRILTDKNEVIDFFWIREFDGSARFFEGGKAYANTVIEVFWKELELYDASQQKYIYYKEIILLEELNTVAEKERKEKLKAYKKEQKKKKSQKK